MIGEVKIAKRGMITQCSICYKRIKPNDRYFDVDSKISVHEDCWNTKFGKVYRSGQSSVKADREFEENILRHSTVARKVTKMMKQMSQVTGDPKLSDVLFVQADFVLEEYRRLVTGEKTEGGKERGKEAKW